MIPENGGWPTGKLVSWLIWLLALVAAYPYIPGSESEASRPRGETAAVSMAQFALRWILMFDAVSCVIPGAKRPSQAVDNIQASALPPLSDEVMARVRELYDQRIRAQVHHLW